MKRATVILFRKDMGTAWGGIAFIPETDQERANGLSRAISIPYGRGMMFRVRQGEMFTTKPMQIPIDMVWMSNGEILRIDRNVRPGRLVAPPDGAKWLLEMGAGHAAKACEGCTLHTVMA